jgi:hypothetical protein
VQFVNFDGIEGTQTALTGSGGFNILPDGTAPVAACPVFQFTYGFGPSLLGVSLRSNLNTFGGQVGIPVGGSANFSAVPTFGVSWAGESLGTSFYGSDRFVEYYGSAVVGVGLRFNEARYAVVPTVRIPFAFDGGSDPQFRIGFIASF